MAYDGLMSQIANPQMADIAGALDYRQRRLEAEQERQKQARLKELVAQAIPGLRKGSVLAEMAELDPDRFVFMTKTLGVPMNEGDKLEQMSQDVRTISRISSRDPAGGIAFAENLSAEREALGLDTTKMRQWVELAKQDPGKAVRAINMLDESLNKDLIDAERMQERKMALEERKLDVQEKEISQGRRPFAGQVVNTSEGLSVFDPTTNSFSRATMDGKPLTGAAYDATIKQDLSAAGAAGAAIGKDVATAKTGLSQIEDNARFLRGKVGELLKHPGRDIATGASSLLPVVPGTKQADFVNRLDQLQGDAFLQAFESLKGGGQITEIEGQKAQQAINRMNRGTTEGEFNSAAKDFIAVVDALEKRTREKAGVKTEQQREINQKPAKQGGVEMVDDNGNRAIVYPDGSYEEL